MSGDYSRWSFDPARHFGAVLMQQGRVHTDADFNEWVATILRRVSTGTLDTIGPATVPRITPDGFRITVAGGDFTIGPGRIYVDGILVENDGGDPHAWDPQLAELHGTTPIAYAEQPYWPEPDALPGGGPHLVYLKAWRREITAVERPAIVEQALGVDTTTRLQTVWQVRLAQDIDGAVTCATALEDIPELVAAEPVAGGRLTTGTADVGGDDDPCLVPPVGGYKGLENQLYRVEIHDAGDLDAATFKWSRENASVAARVTAIPALDRIVVDSLGRDDATLGLSDGDWIEITDDHRELAGLPGELRRIQTAGGVEAATNTIHLTSAVTAGLFPVDAQGATAEGRNTRIRRWDQAGRVLDVADNELVDLDAAAATGTIPVTGGGTQIVLEHGIVVTLSLDAAGGTFRTGDHWMFAARTADASVEALTEAPPLGVHAHYAKLAIVDFPDTGTDCRVLWPPIDQVGGGGDADCCDCTVCVTPESHASGELTIQDAIESVKERGGTVCLAAGTYPIREPIRIEDARAVRLHGQGLASVIVMAGTGMALRIRTALDVRVDDLAVVSSDAQQSTAVVEIADAIDVTVRDCFVLGVGPENGDMACIGLDDIVVGCRIERCALAAKTGVVGGRPRSEKKLGILVSAALRIEDNWMWCPSTGIALTETCLHLLDTAISGNVILGCDRGGIGALGANAAGPFGVSRNIVNAARFGVTLGLGRARVTDNDITGRTLREEIAPIGRGGAIVIAPGLDPRPIDIEAGDNRLAEFPVGIAITRPLKAGNLTGNQIIDMDRAGIAMAGDAGALQLAIHDNQFRDIGAATDQPDAELAAIRVINVVDLSVSRNRLLGLGTGTPSAAELDGIVAMGIADARIADNRLALIAPPGRFAGAAVGIRLLGWFQSAGLHQNTILRTAGGKVGDEAPRSDWTGIDVMLLNADEGLERWFSADDASMFEVSEDRAVMLTGTHAHAFAFKTSSADIAIDGNEIVAGVISGRPLRVGFARGLRLLGNRIDSQPRDESIVSCRRGIVSNNDIRSGKTLSLEIQLQGQEQAAVIGNVTTGLIQLNGAGLPAPYADLNPQIVD